MKILIVDDNQDILDSVQLILEMEKHTIITATNIDQALQESKVSEPDLIIFDVHLAGDDGRKLLTQLKAATEPRNIPFIAFSADNSVWESVKQAGADDFLAKPFEVEDLLNLVVKHGQ
jgi:DNA-binding response OmpR family regulator